MESESKCPQEEEKKEQDGNILSKQDEPEQSRDGSEEKSIEAQKPLESLKSTSKMSKSCKTENLEGGENLIEMEDNQNRMVDCEVQTDDVYMGLLTPTFEQHKGREYYEENKLRGHLYFTLKEDHEDVKDELKRVQTYHKLMLDEERKKSNEKVKKMRNKVKEVKKENKRLEKRVKDVSKTKERIASKNKDLQKKLESKNLRDNEETKKEFEKYDEKMTSLKEDNGKKTKEVEQLKEDGKFKQEYIKKLKSDLKKEKENYKKLSEVSGKKMSEMVAKNKALVGKLREDVRILEAKNNELLKLLDGRSGGGKGGVGINVGKEKEMKMLQAKMEGLEDTLNIKEDEIETIKMRNTELGQLVRKQKEELKKFLSEKDVVMKAYSQVRKQNRDLKQNIKDYKRAQQGQVGGVGGRRGDDFGKEHEHHHPDAEREPQQQRQQQRRDRDWDGPHSHSRKMRYFDEQHEYDYDYNHGGGSRRNGGYQSQRRGGNNSNEPGEWERPRRQQHGHDDWDGGRNWNRRGDSGRGRGGRKNGRRGYRGGGGDKRDSWEDDREVVDNQQRRSRSPHDRDRSRGGGGRSGGRGSNDRGKRKKHHGGKRKYNRKGGGGDRDGQ